MTQDPQVVAAIISGVCTIAAAALAAIAAAVIGKRFTDREKLKSDLEAAIQDIHFLLKVEQRHCDMHKDANGESNRNRVREAVARDNEVKWSGRFTPGRTKDV